MSNWGSGFVVIINYSTPITGAIPPPGTFFRITDASEIRITDTNDMRITDS